MYSEIVEAYLDRFLGEAQQVEAQRLEALIQFGKDYPKAFSQIDRSNMDGHITASALVLSPDHTHLMLIDHARLGKRLPPGGHIDSPKESPRDAALRELREETGVKLSHLEPIDSPTIPIDIDSHKIPASPKRGESEHLHHDFRFVFRCRAEVFGKQVSDVQWRSPENGRFVAWFPLAEALEAERLVKKLLEI